MFSFAIAASTLLQSTDAQPRRYAITAVMLPDRYADDSASESDAAEKTR
jgi:hypothetical protein